MVATRQGWRLRILVPATAVLGLAVGQAGVDGATSLPTLMVSESEAIALEFGAVGSTNEAIVTVVNPSDADAHLTVRLAAEGSLSTAVSVTADPATVTAGDASRVQLTFTLREATTGGPASVVIGADGFAPATVPVVIAAAGIAGAGIAPVGALPVLSVAVVAALLFLGLRVWTLRGKYDTDGKLGSVKWDFSSSWATNITTIGAILGTVTAAGLLPEEGRLLAANEVAGLSVLFGVLAVLSGFVYTVLSEPVLEDGEPARQGFVRPFLLAAGITVAAVVGELVTLGLVLIDAVLQQPTLSISIFLLALLAIAGFLVLRHAWATMGWTLINLVKPRTVPGHRGIAVPAKNWSLL